MTQPAAGDGRKNLSWRNRFVVAALVGVAVAVVFAFSLPAVPLWEFDLPVGDEVRWDFRHAVIPTSDPARFALVRNGPGAFVSVRRFGDGAETQHCALRDLPLGILVGRSEVDLDRGRLVVHVWPGQPIGKGWNPGPRFAVVYGLMDGVPILRLEAGEDQVRGIYAVEDSLVSYRTAKGARTETVFETTPIKPGGKPVEKLRIDGSINQTALVKPRLILAERIHTESDVMQVMLGLYDLKELRLLREWPDRKLAAVNGDGSFTMREMPGGRSLNWWENGRPAWRVDLGTLKETQESVPTRPPSLLCQVQDPETGRTRWFAGQDDTTTLTWGAPGRWLDQAIGIQLPHRDFPAWSLAEVDIEGRLLRTVLTSAARLGGGRTSEGGIHVTVLIDDAGRQRLTGWDLLEPARPWGKAVAGGLVVAFVAWLVLAWVGRRAAKARPADENAPAGAAGA